MSRDLSLGGVHSGGAGMMNAADVYGFLRKACSEAGGQSAWATAHGFTPQHVSDVLSARRPFSAAVLAALGLRQVVRFLEVTK